MDEIIKAFAEKSTVGQLKKSAIGSGFCFVLLTLALTSCRTSPPNEGVPEWARQPTRTVDNGYIVYVESDDDPSLERARFKAESMALQDLANECTLVPKGVRIEDRYDHQQGTVHQSFAKIGVEIQVCEEAKHAMTPDAIRNLANLPMTEQIKRYQDEIGQPEELVANNEREEGEELKNLPSRPQERYIEPDTHFYIVRQQIFMAKQTVILAPAATYQPTTLESKQITEHLAQQSQYVSHYEVEHPTVKSNTRAWSHYQHQLMRPKVNSEFKPLAPPPRSGPQRMGKGQHGNSKRRRRFNKENVEK